MKIYKIDYDLSKEVYEKAKKKNISILPQQCYNNVFNIVTNLDELYIYSNKCRVGYCYLITSTLPIFAMRHCVIITNDDKLIDVTAFTYDNLIKDNIVKDTYFVFDTLDFKLYSKSIIDNDGYVDNKINGNDLDFYKNIIGEKEYGYCQIVESDYIKYILPKLDKDIEEEVYKKIQRNFFNEN